MARILLEAYGSLEELFRARRAYEEISQLDGIGPGIAQDIANMLNDEGMRQEIRRLGSAGLRMDHETVQVQDAKLTGKTFVITGTLPGMSRDEAKSFIEKNGGKAVSYTHLDVYKRQESYSRNPSGEWNYSGNHAAGRGYLDAPFRPLHFGWIRVYKG